MFGDNEMISEKEIRKRIEDYQKIYDNTEKLIKQNTKDLIESLPHNVGNRESLDRNLTLLIKLSSEIRTLLWVLGE